MNLLLLLILPLITALGILFSSTTKWLKNIAYAGSFLQLIVCIVLFIDYTNQRNNGNNSTFLYELNYNWFQSIPIHFHIGIDGISLSMIMLTSLVVFGGILISWHIQKMTKEFYFLLILLSIGAYGYFISLDLFLLFFFLELAVIPKYLLIGIWGTGKKEYAANKLALMLMGGSALVLAGIFMLYYLSSQNTFDIVEISKQTLPLFTQKIIFPLLFIGFGVFSALIPFHTWVPDGHSSAPTAGSMFLAGISMKLGGYGCLRVATYLLPDAAKEYAWLIVLLSVLGIVFGAFATLMQKDLKYMNAYSSISHCGFVLLGIGMLTKTSITGSVMQMVSHGLMTALFFAIIGMVYERTHTRQIKDMGGLLKIYPFISTVFVLVGLCSLGLPGFSGFVSEMMIFVGSWQHKGLGFKIATIASIISILITAVYILQAIGTVIMGKLKTPNSKHFLSSNSIYDARWNEKLTSIILLIAILIIGIFPNILTQLVNPATEIIVQKLFHNN